MNPNIPYTEPYRPQFHFSPARKWMNDPNGLVYHNGIYHLFYQYYPDDVIWGPMHWGHAVSRDLMRWEHKPIALFPDKLGYIFSGSAVFDEHNTSNLGSPENPPLVAVFTYHDPEKEALRTADHQTQGIAFSLDGGETWEKYPGNPVLDNKGEFMDIRDPKVFWDPDASRWIMLLVAGDHLRIYASPNLIEWTYLSSFGSDQGAHGGVWECPDMFPLTVEGSDEIKWVLLISINPGGPNGGSATQYFVGHFDGTSFTSDQQEVRWVDPGADNYAGVTYNHTPDGKRVFLGWMGNWNYAPRTPTEGWRGAMTLPRELSLHKVNGDFELKSYPLEGFDTLRQPITVEKELLTNGSSYEYGLPDTVEVIFETTLADQQWVFANEADEVLILTLHARERSLKIDRTKSGNTQFDPSFAAEVHTCSLPNVPSGTFEVRLILDACSLEVFLNRGQYAMTTLVFPNLPFTRFSLLGSTTPRDPVCYRIQRLW